MDFFKSYFSYAGYGVSEPPAIFHRWTALSIIGTLLGRQLWFPFGHGEIYPNQYIMIMGSPGTRKSTAINIGAKLLRASGYTRFASDRTSKERFLMDMCCLDEELEIEDLENLTLDEPAEVCIAADEFTDFIGNNNTEFITMLTKLWDNPQDYKHPKIHGKSLIVNKPTINIISGNTLQNFTLAFPVEALGNGFLSRALLVHGEGTGRKITFPAAPDELVKAQLITHLKDIQYKCKGGVSKTKEATKLFDKVYREYKDLDDPRFKHYNTRRFTHLIKLSMIIAASFLRTEIEEGDIIKANTVLYYTELKMPKALGEFGKSKYSDVTSTVIDVIEHSAKPPSFQDLWKKVGKDLNKMTELTELLRNLQHADRITVTKTGPKSTGYILLHQVDTSWAEEFLDNDWMTLEELE